MLKWMRRFFINYVWIGIILVLIAIILDLQYPIQALTLSCLIKLLEAVGIAILVAAIFTFASGTSQFIQKISRLLQDVVLSRKFLGNIDTESKREALLAIIRPTTEEQMIYSNLEDYYNTYIRQTMNVSKKCVRSNYHVYSRVWFDPTIHRIIIQETATYRLYPTPDGYSDIKLGFYDISSEDVPICEHLVINAPNGKTETESPWELKPDIKDGRPAFLATKSLKDIGDGCAHLDIELRVQSREHDHWATLGFQALQPTDGFRYQVQCEDDIHVCSIQTFSYGAKLDIDDSNPSELFVRCNQWLNEGAGLSVVVTQTPDEGEQGNREVREKADEVE